MLSNMPFPEIFSSFSCLTYSSFFPFQIKATLATCLVCTVALWPSTAKQIRSSFELTFSTCKLEKRCTPSSGPSSMTQSGLTVSEFFVFNFLHIFKPFFAFQNQTLWALLSLVITCTFSSVSLLWSTSTVARPSTLASLEFVSETLADEIFSIKTGPPLCEFVSIQYYQDYYHFYYHTYQY